jgi:hypothetical protein
MTECEPEFPQQARIASTEYRGPALVMQSGSRLALEIGTKGELDARLRDWLNVIGAGQKGEALSREIEDCVVVALWALLAAGLSITFSKEIDGEDLGGAHVQ